MRPISFKRRRFPPDVIRYAVWLYFRFTLSIRDVEELLAQRGRGGQSRSGSMLGEQVWAADGRQSSQGCCQSNANSSPLRPWRPRRRLS